VAPDLCRYDTNIGGPQIRRGAWQTVMPGKAYADTGIGCTVVTGDKPFNYEGYLETANLPVLSPGAVDAYDRPGSLFVAGPEETGTRASLAGPDWIASGWTFQPRPGIFGDPTSPPPQGWSLAQVWFADAHGLGGWLALTCTAKTGALSGPRGYLGLGQEAHLDAAAPTRLTAGQLSLQVWGDQVASLDPEVRTAANVGWLTHNFAWVTLKNVAERVYEPGETFGYGLSGCPSDSAPLEVRALPAGPALVAQIVRPRGAPVTLFFNPTAAAVTVDASAVAGATVCTCTDHPGAGTSQPWTAGKVTLKPYALAVVMP
jgi:hypothetical protein